MDYTNDEIEKSLLDTATDPQYSDALKDFAEAGIDAIFNSEIVDAIPVVRSISALLKGVVTIQDRIFLKKLARFLAEANRLTIEEREAWYEKHINGKGKVEAELADKLIMMIDAVNDDYKASAIGKVFRAFVRGEIDRIEDFYYLVELVESCFTNILKALESGREMTDEALFRAGIKHASSPKREDIEEMLARDRSVSRGMAVGASPPYENTGYTVAGKTLIKILRAS